MAASMAGDEAQQFIELVRSKLAADEFNDFLVDLRNLHKYSSAGDLIEGVVSRVGGDHM